MPYAVTLRCNADEADSLLAELMDFDTAGVEQTGAGLTVHFADVRVAGRCASQFQQYQATIAELETRNWAEEWQQHWQPALLGSRFYLSPPWSQSPPPDGRMRLLMRPGLVFGGGDHPTTQLCVQFLEDWVRAGDTVADIGCGSGILGDAALQLGAGRVIACDIEFAATQATREAIPTGLVFCGSADALRPETADVVVANLLTGIVVSLLPRFAAILKPGGILIVSGFLPEQAEAIDARATASGLHRRAHQVQGDWAASVYSASAIRAGLPALG